MTPAESFGAVCIHDCLRRSCEVCDLTERLEQAEATIERLQTERDAYKAESAVFTRSWVQAARQIRSLEERAERAEAALLSAAEAHEKLHEIAQSFFARTSLSDLALAQGVRVGDRIQTSGDEATDDEIEAFVARIYSQRSQVVSVATFCPHDGFWSVEVRDGKVVAVIKLVQSIEDVTR